MGTVHFGQKCTHCDYNPGFVSQGCGFALLVVGPATCRTCDSIVSVHRDHHTIQEEEWKGDYRAHLVELSRPNKHHMLTTKQLSDIKFNTCPKCGGHDLVHHGPVALYEVKRREGKIDENETFHLPCPRCETGKIVFLRGVNWD